MKMAKPVQIVPYLDRTLGELTQPILHLYSNKKKKLINFFFDRLLQLNVIFTNKVGIRDLDKIDSGSEIIFYKSSTQIFLIH